MQINSLILVSYIEGPCHCFSIVSTPPVGHLLLVMMTDVPM